MTRRIGSAAVWLLVGALSVTAPAPPVAAATPTDVVILTCIPGEATFFDVLATSSSPGAPTFAVHGECADDLAVLLSAGFVTVAAGLETYTLKRVADATPRGVDVVLLRCGAGGLQPTHDLLVADVSPGAPAISPQNADCADVLADLLSAGFTIAHVVTRYGENFTLTRMRASGGDTAARDARVVLLTCDPGLFLAVNSYSSSPGSPAFEPAVTGCADALAKLYDLGFTLFAARRDENNHPHFVLTTLGPATALAPTRVVVVRCGPSFRVSSSLGAPTFPTDRTCADATATLLGLGYELASSMLETSDGPHWYLTFVTGSGSRPGRAAALLFACNEGGAPGSFFAEGASSSTLAPGPFDGYFCATAFVRTLEAGFTLRPGEAGPPYFLATREVVGPAPRVRTSALTLRCIGGGGETSIPATLVSAEGFAPVPVPGTECADAIAAALAKGHAFQDVLIDENAIYYFLVSRTGAARAPSGKVVILECGGGPIDGTTIVGNYGGSTGAPFFPILSDCASGVASLLSGGFELVLPRNLPGCCPPLYYTFVER
jgi:hypothetical protein